VLVAVVEVLVAVVKVRQTSEVDHRAGDKVQSEGDPRPPTRHHQTKANVSSAERRSTERAKFARRWMRIASTAEKLATMPGFVGVQKHRTPRMKKMEQSR
jgi:hypothetical protein